MLERIEKLQVLTVGILAVLTVFVCVKMLSASFSGNTISVTGSAYEIVKSDSGTLSFNITVKRPTKQEAYTALQSQIKIVEQYLKDKNITDIERKTINGYYSYKRDPKNGAYTDIPEAYNLSQPFMIGSNNVELIKEISNDITGLINKGVDVNVFAVSYNYSKLPDLKVSLLEKYGYTEQMAFDLCKKYDLISPIYDFAPRGGCWFCPNARYAELKHLRTHHPDLWNKLLELENESDLIGNMWNVLTKTRIHDWEERFYWEERQMHIFDFIKEE